MPKVVVDMLICDCGCGDTIVRTVTVDGKPVADADLSVNTIHGWVGTNVNGQTEIRDDDGELLETLDFEDADDLLHKEIMDSGMTTEDMYHDGVILYPPFDDVEPFKNYEIDGD